jgi:hypothetical protein
MKQYERLHAHLNQFGSITPLVAWTELGIYRLSDAVYKLRKQGVKIETAYVDIKNQFEETCHVAKYIIQ